MSDSSPVQRDISRETDCTGLSIISSPASSEYVHNFLETLGSTATEDLAVIEDGAPFENLTGHVLIAGCFETHRWVKELYFKNWLCTDQIHPGPGGYELKTLCGALHPSSNVILIGAADGEGLQRGFDRISSVWRDSEGRMPFLFEVEPSEVVLETAEEDKAFAVRNEDVSGHTPGSWEGFREVAQLGAHAAYTARSSFVEAFKTQLLIGLNERGGEGIPASVIALFRNLEAHPIWRDEDRRKVVSSFYRVGQEMADKSHALETPLLSSEASRLGLALHQIGNYFSEFCQLPESEIWCERSAQLFESALTSSKYGSDSSGHEWKVLTLNVAAYALTTGNTEYFDREHFKKAVKRALQCFSNQGLESIIGAQDGPGCAPWTIFSMAAAIYGDGSFMAPFEFWDRDHRELFRPWQCGDEMLRSFCVSIDYEANAELSGLCVAELDKEFIRKSLVDDTGVYSTQGQVNRPFDKVSFRSGFRAEDDYLLLDGVAGGQHSYEDVNCIKELQMRGYPWLCSLDIGMRESGIAGQNGVLLLKDGQRSKLPRFAELMDFNSVAAGGHSVSKVEGYSGADWTRSVFWRAAGFVLVIDEVEVKESGRFQMESRWYCLGRPIEAKWAAFELGDTDADLARLSIGWDNTVECEVDRLDYSDEFYSYYVEQAQREHEMYSCCEVPATLHRLRLRKVFDGQPGQKVSIATRLLCTLPGDQIRKEYSLERDTTVIFVEVPGQDVQEFPFINEAESIGLDTVITDEEVGAPLFPYRPTATAVREADGSVIVGFEEGRVVILDGETGEVSFEDTLQGKINAVSSAMIGGRIYQFAGTEEGELVCWDSDMNVLWKSETAIQGEDVAAKLEAIWSSHDAGIRTLLCVEGRSENLLVAGCGDGFIYGLDPLDGNRNWEVRLQRGCCSHLVRADFNQDGFEEIIAGTCSPSSTGSIRVFSTDGELLASLHTEHDNPLVMTSEMTALLARDIDGDGHVELVCGASHHLHHLSCWRGIELLWTLDTGEWPVVIVQIAGRDLLVGSRSGWVFLVTTDGKVSSRFYLGESVTCSTAVSERYLIGGKSGGLFEVDPESNSLKLLRRFSNAVESILFGGDRVMAFMESGEIFIS